MLSKKVTIDQAAALLDLAGPKDLEGAVSSGALKTVSGNKQKRFLLEDIIIYKLAATLEHMGAPTEKAVRYAEAILGSRLQTQTNLVEWVENETQELFCLIADDQLSRIFLRKKDDFKEIEVGATKPVLFPTTLCEINIFRLIRPIVIRAKQMFEAKQV
jgi:hypothetical protein